MRRTQVGTDHAEARAPARVPGLAREGYAETRGQGLPLGVDDPVIAARAVRRALAQAGRHARDVEMMVVATGHPAAGAALRQFARRSLGPHGTEVTLRHVLPPDGRGDDARRLARLAEAALPRRGSPSDARVSIAVGVGDDGAVVAVCLSRVRPGIAPPGR